LHDSDKPTHKDIAHGVDLSSVMHAELEKNPCNMCQFSINFVYT